MKHISRPKVCWDDSIHLQAKAYMLRPPDWKIGEISVKGQYCNAFLHLPAHGLSPEFGCKNTNIF